jgi:hypothetical protein
MAAHVIPRVSLPVGDTVRGRRRERGKETEREGEKEKRWRDDALG